MLRSHGVDVATYFRSNDELPDFSKAALASVPLRLFHSPSDVRAFRKLIRAFRPDVVHVHNPYPLISPSVVRVAHAEKVPVVATVHNYQHVCAAQTYFRLDIAEECRRCAGRRLPTPAVRFACYHDSRVQSALMAGAIVAARPVWRLVDRFLPVSRPIADHLIETGIPSSRITIKPNSFPDPGPPSPPGRGFLLACRLRSEKGVRILLRAWELAGIGPVSRLVIAGDGPDRPYVEDAAKHLPGVEYAGMVSRETVGVLMEESAVLVQPSQWHEPFGMTVAEAMARGRPVLATAMGGMAELVDDEVGWSVATDAASIADALRAAAVADVGALGAAARRRYETRLSPPVVLEQLLRVYEEVSRR